MCDEDNEMDFDDWVAASCPIADQQAVTKAANLINRARAFNTNGGNFHIVLEDGNTEDHHITFCLSQVADRRAGVWEKPASWGDDDSARDPALLTVEWEMGVLLVSMSVSDRIAALAVADGWVAQVGSTHVLS